MTPRRSLALFAGTWTLVRLFLRRDRLRVPLWLVGITAFITGSGASLANVFASDAARASRAQLMANPTLRALRGPGYGFEDFTTGAMVAHELFLIAGIAAAIMSIFVVTRHTRAEEAAGRVELLRSTVVGVHAISTAALVVAVGANLALASLLAIALQAAITDLPGAGAWLLGVSTAAVGVSFAAVTLLCAQAIGHARGASGAAGVVLAVAFTLRAVGDTGGVGDRALSWASPLGWAQSTRAFVDERWWPLLLCLAFSVLLVSAAFAVAWRRDVGAGLLPSRPGPANASDGLVRPAGLALRLQRGSIVGWSLGAALLCASFGAVIGDIEAFLAENPQLDAIFGRATGAGLLDSFLATVVLVLVLVATGYATASALRLVAEEAAGRTEAVLATPVSRIRWIGGHLFVLLGGSAIVVLAGALGLGGAAAVSRREPGYLVELVAAGLGYLPAVWLVIGVAVALYGLRPRLANVAWFVVAHAAVVALLGEALDLPASIRALSPLHHVPALPAAEVSWPPLLALSVVAGTLTALGLAIFSRRDLNVA